MSGVKNRFAWIHAVVTIVVVLSSILLPYQRARAESVQITPGISNEASNLPDSSIGYFEFRSITKSFNYPGGNVCISSSSSSCAPLQVDDGIKVWVNNQFVGDFLSRTQPVGPIVLPPSMLVAGTNQVRVILYDIQGRYRGTSPLYVVYGANAQPPQILEVDWEDMNLNEPFVKLNIRVKRPDGSNWPGVEVRIAAENAIPNPSVVTTNAEGYARVQLALNPRIDSAIVAVSTNLVTRQIQVLPTFAIVLSMSIEQGIFRCGNTLPQCVPVAVGDKLHVGDSIRIEPYGPYEIVIAFFDGHTMTFDMETLRVPEGGVILEIGPTGFTNERSLVLAHVDIALLQFQLCLDDPNCLTSEIFKQAFGEGINMVWPIKNFLFRTIRDFGITKILEGPNNLVQASQAPDADEVGMTAFLDGISEVAVNNGIYEILTDTGNRLKVSAGQIAYVSADGRVGFDTTPPNTLAYATGPLDMNNIFKDKVTISFECTDDLSGVERVEYSQNGGSTWTSILPFDTFSIDGSGISSFLYRCIDRAGNVEAVKDSGPILINKYIVFQGGTATTIFDRNAPSSINGTMHTNGNASITYNTGVRLNGVWNIVGTVTSSGNTNTVIPTAKTTPQQMLSYPIARYEQMADVIYPSSVTINSSGKMLRGIHFVKGNLTLKSATLTGDVTFVATGSIYDYSTGTSIVNSDPNNGIVFYAGGGITINSTGSSYVGMYYAPNGTIMLDGVSGMQLNGSLVGKTVAIKRITNSTISYNVGFPPSTHALPLVPLVGAAMVETDFDSSEPPAEDFAVPLYLPFISE